MDTYKQLKQLETKLMTTREVAYRLLAGPDDIRKIVISGWLRGVNFKGLWLVSEEALQEFMEREDIREGEPLHPPPGSEISERRWPTNLFDPNWSKRYEEREQWDKEREQWLREQRKLNFPDSGDD